MKKVILLLAVLPLLLGGCNPTKYYDKLENPQQQGFDNFLSENRTLSYTKDNEIQKKEFYKKFENELFNYIDSIKIFVNWKGQISDIETDESGKSTKISFKITYQPEEYRKIEFVCTHIADTDSLEQDYIYNQVKNISNYSTVYFDGFIRTNNKNEVDYAYGQKDLNIPYPDYKFWILDIGNEKRNDTLSQDLQKAVYATYDIVQPLKLNYMNEITKEESDKRFNDLLPAYNELKYKISDIERTYIQRLNTCLIYNFLYGD